MSPRAIALRNLSEGFPRVSGDEPSIRGGNGKVTAFSPRERG